MSNFEEYLNDYSLNNESDEQLDPPMVSNNYDNYSSNDSYGYSDAGYGDRYSDNGYQDDYSDGYSEKRSSRRAEKQYDRDEEEYDSRFDDDYGDRPVKKNFNPASRFGGSSSAESGSAAGSLSNKILMGLIVVCIALSLISVFSLGGIKKSVKETRDTLSSQIASLAAQTSELADRVSALETGVSTVQEHTVNPGTSKYITIAKQPTSVTTYVGRGEDSLAMFFSVAAKGNGVGFDSFVWQKQDAGGNWVSVGFDGVNSKNEAFGLQNEVGKYDSGDYAGCYYSIIYSFGLTSSGFGQYRCMISDSTGEVTYSDIVEIRNG